MKLILFATLFEAKSSLEALNAAQISPHCYSFNKGVIVISGMGSKKAKDALLTFADQATSVWNVGFAGALNDHFEIGETFEVKSVSKFSPLAIPKLTLPKGEIALLTSDFPIHNVALRSTLKSRYDFVDMEGYSVVATCQRLQKPCRLTKIVSDFASEHGSSLIKQQGKFLSEKLAALIKSNLDRLTDPI